MTLMYGNRGFTLIEVLIALTILVTAFGVLFDIIYKSNKDLDSAIKTFEDVIFIDNKVKLNDLKDIEVSHRSLSIYPQLLERQYRYREVSLIEYELKKH